MCADMFFVVVAVASMSMTCQALAAPTDGAESRPLSKAPPYYPQFSWDTVPVFWHAANTSGPLTPETVEYVAKHYPLATIEKMQCQQCEPMGNDAETKIVAALAQLKKANPNIKTLFYLNSIMDWNMYTLHHVMANHSSYWLHDRNGSIVLLRNQTIFDFTQEPVRKLWLGTLAKAAASGHVDGCFLDRGTENITVGSGWGANVDPKLAAAWNEAHRQVVQQAQSEIFPQGIVISNNGDYDTVNGRMFERFAVRDFDQQTTEQEIENVQADAAAGHVIEAHGEPIQPQPDGRCDPFTFNVSLAAFLIGAGDYSYYHCTQGWTANDGWQIFYPEFSKPLGTPNGMAARNGDVFTRTFSSSHGTVKVRLVTNADPSKECSCIQWTDGSITGMQSCCA